MNLSKSLSVVFYLAGTILSRALVAISFPLATHVVAPHDLGTASLFLSVVGILSIAFRCGANDLLVGRWSSIIDSENKTETLRIFHSIFFIPFSLFFVAVSVFSAFSLVFSLSSAQYIYLVLLMLVSVFFSFFQSLSEQLFILESRIKLIALLHALRGVLYAAILLVCLTILKLGAVALILAPIFGSCVWFIAYSVRERNALKSSLWWKPKHTLTAKEGLPFVASSLIVALVFIADRWLVGAVSGLDQLAIYDVAWKIGLAYEFLVVVSFNTLYTSFIIGKLSLDSNAGMLLHQRILLCATLIALVFALTPISLYEAASFIVGKNYALSMHYTKQVLVIVSMSHVLSLVQLMLTIQRRSANILRLSMVRLLLTAGVGGALLPIIGVNGMFAGCLIGVLGALSVGYFNLTRAAKEKA